MIMRSILLNFAIAIIAGSAQAFIARDKEDFTIPSLYETACVQLLMDIDMLWHYTIEGESIETARSRVVLDKTPSYDIPTATLQERIALDWVKQLHRDALEYLEERLRGHMKQAELLEKGLDDVTYASMRRGTQETFYQACRFGVFRRLNTFR